MSDKEKWYNWEIVYLEDNEERVTYVRSRTLKDACDSFYAFPHPERRTVISIRMEDER